MVRLPGSQHFGVAEFLNKLGYRPAGATEPPEARWYVSFFDGTLEFGVPRELVVPPWTRMLAQEVIGEATAREATNGAAR